jgi:NTE family protein
MLDDDTSLLSTAARSDVTWSGHLWIAAVRLSDRQTVIFGRDVLGMTLGEAVDASCAVPYLVGPKPVAGEFYMDGAVNSPTNASVVLAEDHDLVVISAPMSRPGRGRHRARAQADLRRDVAEIEAAGLRPTVLVPSPAISAAAVRYPYRNREVRKGIVDDARRQLIEALG